VDDLLNEDEDEEDIGGAVGDVWHVLAFLDERLLGREQVEESSRAKRVLFERGSVRHIFFNLNNA